MSAAGTSRFPCPSVEEIQAASDAITKDGPGAEATGLLSVLAIISPVLKEAHQQKMKLLSAFVKVPDYNSMPGGSLVKDFLTDAEKNGIDPTHGLLNGSIASLTMYGLNLGIRIGEARREGLRSRASVESLLAHVQAGTCTHSDAERAAAVRVLRWVLGETVVI